ncbi:MAG: hypothetical protein PHT12_05410 [Patescibacteria group bacterium]|nr:hypothetical protein [Patescibacteria group bacterium]
MSLAPEKQFADAVGKASHVLVTFRRDWCVDAVAAALALEMALKKRGKHVDVVADGFEAPASLRFLPGAAAIQSAFRHLQRFVISLDLSRSKLDELSYDFDGDRLRIHVTPKTGQFEAKDVATSASDYKYDLIVSLGAPDYPSLGAVFTANPEFFYQRPTVNIDCDPGNERHGNMNFVDVTVTSTSEAVFNLLKAVGEPFLDEDVATCLLAGMIAATKSFRTPNITPKALATASELIAAGARREEIIEKLYRTRSIATLKLWGRALSRLKHDPNAKFAWTMLVRQDFIHAGAREETLPDVIDELIANAPEAEIVGILYEQEDAAAPGQVSGICAIVASEKHADASALVASLRPSGTRRMARVCFPGADLLTAEKSILSSIYKSLGKKLTLVEDEPARPPVNTNPLTVAAPPPPAPPEPQPSRTPADVTAAELSAAASAAVMAAAAPAAEEIPLPAPQPEEQVVIAEPDPTEPVMEMPLPASS